MRILDWQDTVCIEHSDRVVRMRRLAEMLPGASRPIFREYVLPRDRLPRAFASGMPLLRVIFPENSFFDTGSSSIRGEAEAALTLIAASLRSEVPDVAVFVAGHADSRGDEDYNYNLSVDRADRVSRRLAQLGIGGVALWRVGFGEAVPLQANDSENGRAVNRRVEFVIGARADPVATWLAEQTPRFCAGRADAVGRCTKPLKRRQFVAEAMSQRTGLVAPPRADPPRSVPVKAEHPRNVHVQTQRRQTAPAPAAQRRNIGLAYKARLVLDLNTRKYSIPAPVR
ncbi:MAG TPA: OmpA family protein [Allosphingosinicella sp.]